MSGYAGIGLPALAQRLADELDCLQLPAPRWTPALKHQGQPVLDVALIGAGMAGLALAAALRFKGMEVLCLDEAEAGFEGPWATTARMETLRSPKQLAGPALGLASLSFRAWFEAQFGAAAWEALDKIPRLQWMDYLRWYRQVLALPVRNRVQVTDLLPNASGLLELQVQQDNAAHSLWARRVVLATGRAGLGGPVLPPWSTQLPRHLWLHTSEPCDYATLKGLKVAVIGAGASAMDSAAEALEAGAQAVHLLVRRKELPRINKGKGAGSPGFVHGHARLSDEWKWRIRHAINTAQVPPPRGSTLRVSRHANAHFHLGCAVQQVKAQANGVLLHTSRGPLAVDRVVFGTGFGVDFSQRPFLRHIAPHLRLWKHRFEAPARMADEELAEFPDLGPAFEFQARAGAHCPGLERVHCFTYPASLSQGVITGDIPAISEGAQRLATELAALLYGEDVALHFERMLAYAEPELLGDEWADSPLPQFKETTT